MATEVHWVSLGAVVALLAATLGIGIYATRVVRTTSDYYVASRAVGPFLNASAISGEYLSAASFLGVAGMVMRFGYDVLWYPVGYAAGYLMLLLFIAAPLRRFGAYTIPDFAEGRFDSQNLRKLSVFFVLVIGLFYMLPQMKGAGITLSAVLGTPYWFGVVTVGAIVAFNVVMGGMKGITFVQAFHFWAKMFAISIPTFLIAIHFGNYQQAFETPQYESLPTFTQPTVIDHKANSSIIVYAPSRFIAAGEGGIRKADGEIFHFSRGDTVELSPGTYVFATSVRAIYPDDTPVPNAPPVSDWLRPFGPLTGEHGSSLLYTYSLIIATIFGTAGLPHILVRFYTNQDGHTARQTTLSVLGLIGTFYLFPPVIGALGRTHAPELYVLGNTDAIVLDLPRRVTPYLLGEIAAAITAAGAFAAFISTTSGLLVSTASGLSHDIYWKMINPRAGARHRLTAFKVSALIIGAAAVLLGLQVERFDINMLVGWAFAIAASCFFPLLALGIWWRRLTTVAAGLGVLLGGCLSSASIIFTMVADSAITSTIDPLVWTLLVQPAIWTMPIAVATMIIGSALTRKHLPEEVRLKMLRLHVPESLGLRADYIRD